MALLALSLSNVGTRATAAARPPLAQRTIVELKDDLKARRVTSVEIVKAYLVRIGSLDRAGPSLRAMIALEPTALYQAEQLDQERRHGRSRGPLHGIPIVLKDNIETAGSLPTTAGSLALLRNVTNRDARAVERLREAGVIILGKTNLSEWANFRSTRSSSGWSSVGGMVRNPYALERSACGSSSGSAVAVAAGFAGAALGTETNGSITCPSSMTGVVGMKPTAGLVSRSLVIPVSFSEDSVGPIARSVPDAALLLQAMAGSDPADPATVDADHHPIRFSPRSLHGARIGVARWSVGNHPGVGALFGRALQVLRRAGAILVELPQPNDLDAIGPAQSLVLATEVKAGLESDLRHTAKGVTVRSLQELIAFNDRNASQVMPWFGQERLIGAAGAKGLDDPNYLAALVNLRSIAGKNGIDRLIADFNVEAIVAPTSGPAWTTDLINGDHYSPVGIGTLAAVAGYPHLTVPMGSIAGLPVGLSFVGRAWTDGRILELGAEYETRTRRRQAPILSQHRERATTRS